MRTGSLVQSVAIIFGGLMLTTAPTMAQGVSVYTQKDTAAETAAAPAEDAEATKPFEIDVTLAAVSDYRFRGISLSDKDPAFQPSITVTHESGLYASVWGSNIADNGGADIEVDLVGGFNKEFGPVSFGINATYYLYPGAASTNYIEFISTLGTEVGPGSIGLTVAYAPKQDNIGDEDSVYVAINGSLPIGGTPLTLVGSFGIEDGAFGDAKRDWSAGVNADVAGFTVGLSYIDTARTGGDSLGKATAVLSVSKSF